MANEILIHGYATGLTTVKAVLRNATHQIWNTAGTPAFETYNAANIADYDIATTEQGAAGCYVATMPTSTAGWYRISGYIIAGASLAEADMLNPIADFIVFWNGTAFIVPLEPTTAGRKLDVSTGGEAGIDWANIGNPTTAQGLSGTTIKEVTDVETKLGTPAGASVSADIAAIEAQTDDIGAAGAGLTALATQASVDTLATYVDTEVAAIKAKTDNLPADPADASDVAAALALIQADTDNIQTRLPAALGANGNIKADVRDYDGTAGTFAAGRPEVNTTHLAGTAYATARAALVQAIWDALTSALTTAGSIGKKLADWTILTAADVWLAATRTLTSAANITSTGGTTVPQTGDSFARIGAAGAGLTGLPWNNSVWDAEVESEVVDGLNNAAFNVYKARVGLVDDNANGADRYVVEWEKNGVPITSGITVPVLTVRKAADDAALINAAAMTVSGEQFIYNAATTERITDGAAYTAFVSATIDGSGRTDKAVVQIGRDST